MSKFVDEISSDDLPYEQSIPPHKIRLGAILLTTLIIFLAVNFFIRWNLFPKDISNKYQLIHLMKEPVDVLILGDSSADLGIRPDIISAETGLKSVNLGTISRWTFIGDIKTLEWYIEKFGPPDKLIIAHAYWVHSLETNPQQFLFDTTIPPKEWHSKYIDLQFQPADIVEDFFIELLPTVFRPILSQELIRHYIFGRDVGRLGVNSDGYNFQQHVLAKSEFEATYQEHKLTLDKEAILTDQVVNSIDGLIKLINDYQIETYVIISPLWETLHTHPNFDRHMKVYRDYWMQIDRDNPMITFDPEILEYPSQWMFDGHHLNNIGAQAFTEYLVDHFLTSN